MRNLKLDILKIDGDAREVVMLYWPYLQVVGKLSTKKKKFRGCSLSDLDYGHEFYKINNYELKKIRSLCTEWKIEYRLNKKDDSFIKNKTKFKSLGDALKAFKAYRVGA